MTEEQEKIIKYVKSRKNWKRPLVFLGMTETHKLRLKNRSFDDLCLEILNMTRIYPSHRWDVLTKKHVWETRRGAARSVGDIWRHILYYRPKTSLFQVMAAFYRIQHHVFSSYCSDVRRRVFSPHLHSSDYVHGGRNEFNVEFRLWEDIDKK